MLTSVIGDIRTGKTKWTYQMESGWSPVTPAISEPLIITGSGTGTLYAINIDNHEIAWEFKINESDV